MADTRMPGAGEDAPIRFKRRKLAHPKPQTLQSTERTAAANTIDGDGDNDNESTSNLRDIIRTRRRPRDRFKDPSRKPQSSQAELVQHEGVHQHPYTSRFVSQTGQVVDRDDQQMAKFVEARLAEQNYRNYGWPIPMHLQAAVEELAPDLKSSFSTTSSKHDTNPVVPAPTELKKNIRVAAGHGKIEEVEVKPTAQVAYEERGAEKIRLGRDGRPRRPPKRRNSDDVRRDQLVEAVLREAKLDFFDAEAATEAPNMSTGNNDEDILERFRAEYYESIEEAKQQQRKPVQREAPKGPKLGGSKSARAKMRLQEEQSAKAKR